MTEPRDHRPWTLHWLDALGRVEPYVPAVEAAVSDVRRRAGAAVALPALDLVVAAVPGRGIPEIGHVGHALHRGAIFLTLDPENPALAGNLGAPLARVIAHELHHALRWETVGYGSTLGAALVSEGLAGHFVTELYASPPEPWESALEPPELAAAAAEAAGTHDSRSYDHAGWFFGAGDRPRWAGYTLGRALVGAWLAAAPGRTAAGAAGIAVGEITPGLATLARGMPAPRG
ncbi:MAG: DUF2268 domain-containing putative Zn-dependent protease [Pseudomonadota bacterium]